VLAEIFHLAAAQLAPAGRHLTQWIDKLGHGEFSVARINDAMMAKCWSSAADKSGRGPGL
jgi:hypothetical protein